MNDKVLLIQKFRNDSFMAVLKDGYTFNDSMVVEAKDKAELDAKIAAAVHCDDRWITWNGRPVLIKGSGQFATGPLKGQYISKGRKMARGKRKGWNNKKAGRYSPNKEQNGSGDSNVKSGTAAAKDNKIKKYSPAAQRTYDKARKAEPAITKDLVDISKSLGMKMEGLDYSVKTGSSTDSKIGRKRKNKQTDTDYVKSMGDLVRYTQMGKHEDLGTNTVKTIKALEEKY